MIEPMSMTMPLLPDWLAWLWSGLLALVVGLHLWHATRMVGAARWWHVAHVAMAAGMIVMFLVPESMGPSATWIGVAVFGALALAMFSAVGWFWQRDRLLNWLWLLSTADMLAMMYMWLPMAARDTAMTYLIVAYLGAETVLWLANPIPRLRRVVWSRRAGSEAETVPAPAQVGPNAAAAPSAAASAAAARSVVTGARETRETARLVADVTVGVRVTLAVMAVAMAWMLIAMAGMTMPAGGTMPMDHMPMDQMPMDHGTHSGEMGDMNDMNDMNDMGDMGAALHPGQP